jgi:hypothetical protein
MELYTPLWAAGWYPKRSNFLCILKIALHSANNMYGSGSWVFFPTQHTSRINAVDMRALRSMIDVKLNVRLTNEVISEECGVNEDVVTKIEKNMFRQEIFEANLSGT